MIKLDKYGEVKEGKLYVTKEQSFDIVSKIIRKMGKPNGFREGKGDNYVGKANGVEIYISKE